MAEGITLSKGIAIKLNLFLSSLGFAIPFLFSHPQLVTGTIVNVFIFVIAAKLPKKAWWPILVFPSLGAVAHGVLFGPQTVFLVYFLPFIWAGNFIQAGIFSTSRSYYLTRVFTAAAAKYLLLFLASSLYFRLHIVPAVFVNAMGTSQLATAVIGGLVAYPLIKALKE